MSEGLTKFMNSEPHVFASFHHMRLNGKVGFDSQGPWAHKASHYRLKGKHPWGANGTRFFCRPWGNVPCEEYAS